MIEIQNEIQMKNFGRIIVEDQSGIDVGESISKSSNDVLEEAAFTYKALRVYRKNATPDNPLVADILCDQLFNVG